MGTKNYNSDHQTDTVTLVPTTLCESVLEMASLPAEFPFLIQDKIIYQDMGELAV